MTVYVDKEKNGYGYMKMCHMTATSLTELHAMADTIGINRKWFQDKSIPHYDICQSKKRLAIQNGAIEVDAKTMIKILRGHSNGRKRSV